MNATREEVYAAIDSERSHQDSRFGGLDAINSVGDFIVYLTEYNSRLIRAYTNSVDPQRGLAEIRKIAGLAVACMEKNGVVNR